MADGGAEEDWNIRRKKDKSIIPAERPNAFYEVANETRTEVNSVEAEDDSPPNEGMTLTFPFNEDGDYAQLQAVDLFTVDPDYASVDELGVGCSNTDNVADEAFLQGEHSLTNNREQLQLLLQQNPVEVTVSGNTNSGSLECPASSSTTNSSTSSEAGDSMSKPGVLTERSDVMDASTKAQGEVFKTAVNLLKDWPSSEEDTMKGKYGREAYLEGVKQFKDSMSRELSGMPFRTEEQFSWTVDKCLNESLTVFYRHTKSREMKGNMLKYCKLRKKDLIHQVQGYKLQVIASLGAKE